MLGCSDAHETIQCTEDVTTVRLPSKKMSDEWCEEMMLKANSDWVEIDIQLFARDCTFADTE